MNGREVYHGALARCAEYNVNAPSTERAALDRATRYQEQLFAKAATINREFFGKDGALTLVDGACDTDDLDPIPMRVQTVRVEDPGDSVYELGTRIALVQLDDSDAELEPRMLLRDGILSQVGTDLADVTSVRVFYSKRPARVEPDEEPELPEQFHELLVVDGAMWLIRKALGLAPSARKEMLDLLQGELNEITADYEKFLAEWNFAEVSRFGGTVRQG